MSRRLTLLHLLGIAAASIALVTVGSMLRPVAAIADDAPALAVIRALMRWDSGWYGEIAKNGYWVRPGAQSPVVFFPLYPMVVGAVSSLGLNRWIAGELVSLGCAIAGIWLFSRWALTVGKSVGDEAAGLYAPWLLALYPFAEYLYGVVYSDALFLLLAVGAFYALEKDRPWLAALLGALSTACRPVAPAIVLGLLARSLERRMKSGQPPRLVEFVPALAGAGLAAYMLFLHVRFDDALAFVHYQSAPGWDQPPGLESWLKLAWFKTLFPVSSLAVKLRLGTHAAATLVALLLVIPTFKRLGAGYGVFCLVAVGLPALSSKDFQGLGRYIIAAFPLFLTVALMLSERPLARRWVPAVFGAGLALLAVALGAGEYVS
jgi:hypothetical protein